MALLEVKNLGISFGGLRAVDDFHISIEKGQLYGLIGPNGAGKTTVFNMLTGVYKPTRELLAWMERISQVKRRSTSTRQELQERSRISVCSRIRAVIDNVKIGLHNQMTYSHADRNLTSAEIS